jgi:hypothetical protein
LPFPYSPAEHATSQPLLQALSTQSLLGGAAKLNFSVRLVYLKFSWGLPFPHSPELQAPCPFRYMSFSVPCFLFSFFPGVGVRLSRGLCWFIPEVSVGTLCAIYLLTCWSASPQQVRSQHLKAREPSWFPHILWHWEDMYGLGAWGCWSFASSWWFFLPGVSLASQQDFCFMELTLSASSL